MLKVIGALYCGKPLISTRSKAKSRVHQLGESVVLENLEILAVQARVVGKVRLLVLGQVNQTSAVAPLGVDNGSLKYSIHKLQSKAHGLGHTKKTPALLSSSACPRVHSVSSTLVTSGRPVTRLKK